MIRIAIVSVLLFPLATAAQTPLELVTDRPDFTESGVTVPRGHAQIETGLVYDHVVDTGNVILPEALVRWSPVSRFEFRFGLPNYVIGDFPTGLSDASVGGKVQLGPVEGWDVGLIAAASLPIGDENLTSDSVDPEFILITGRDLSSTVSLGAQGMVMYDGGGDVWQFGGTLVVGVGLGERVGTFGEVMIVDQRGNNVATTVHHGYTYLITRTLQLDVHAGFTFFEIGGSQALVGVGLSTLL